MAQTRMSISIDEASAAAIREAAAADDVPVSSFIEQILMREIERRRRVTDLFAAWDADDVAASREAAAMTDDEAWDGPPLPPGQASALDEQLARIAARAGFRRGA